jgi:hypothetical protein
MVVTVQGRAMPDGTASATSIDFRTEVQGVVTGVDNAARVFTVLGQRVRTDALTVFSGGTFDTLLNQYVEVSGFRAAPGELLATRIEIRLTVAGAPPLEVTGVIVAFNSVAKTFLLGTQLVDYSQIAVAFLPTGLANGLVVRAKGTVITAGGALVASELEVVTTSVQAADASKVELEGLVTDFTGLASFRVNGQLVDGRSATVTGGTAAMLVNGVKVEVEGSLAQGVVVAAKIEIEQEADVSLDGTVEAVDTAGGAVTVAGQRIAVTAATQFEDRSTAALRDFNLAAIRVGDRLSVEATRSATGLVAERIVRLDASAPSSGPEAKTEGVISDFVSIASFSVAGRKVNASSAHFEQGAAAELANGVRVDVEGVLAGDVLMATKVEFRVSAPTGTASIEGTITDFVSPANFKVAGQAVDATGAVFSGGTAANLVNGRRVEVEGTVTGGILRAVAVRFEDQASSSTLEVEGSITDFAGIANFKVAGQRVDASTAVFKNGTAADLANGRRVGVRGLLVGGVLQASALEFKDASAQTEASVEGTITSFVSVADFMVAARRVDASAAAFEHGSAADLANGRRVQVKGFLVAEVLRATKVSLD